jgi:predicted alpha-1,2-mannosidase
MQKAWKSRPDKSIIRVAQGVWPYFNPSITFLIAALGLVSLSSSCAGQPQPESTYSRDPYQLVNPFIGTGGHGHTHPAAMRPFGMIQAGPDTRLEGWDGCSGYHYDDDTIYGFSQTHLSGTGVSDYGDVLLMPFAGDASEDGFKPYAFATGFRHSDEVVRPGYYQVLLQNGIQVEIAASDRAALYRIIYPPNSPNPALAIDLDHRDLVREASIQQNAENTVSGFRISDAWALNQQVYFQLKANRDMSGYTHQGNKAILQFSRKSAASQPDTILFKIAISPVDLKGASRNLTAEIPAFDWAALSGQTESIWREALSRITVGGGTAAQRSIFYTAVYHALSAPNLFADVDGRFRGMDHQAHQASQAQDFTPYTVFSLWDTYRAAHPLYSLCWPELNSNVIKTMLDDADRGGRLPVWKLADYETDCMIGYHSVPVIADAWNKGYRDFDARRALKAMVASAERPAAGLPAYRRYGFIPADAESESVSKTLEYAYDDACIANMAAQLAQEHQQGARTESGLEDGRSYLALADTFARRASGWKHLLDPETGFFRARQNGGFIEPFDPAEVNFHYTEANAWHYAFSAPQDLIGHAAMLDAAAHAKPASNPQAAPASNPQSSSQPKSQTAPPVGTQENEQPFSQAQEALLPESAYEALSAKLDELFSASEATTGREQADITGLIGQYAHGNEPSHHIAYLYAHLGQPWKTQQKVRQILNTLYQNQPDGLCGNEDCGQMSAWYVLSAAGFYPVAPGLSSYTLGSPLFDTITFNMPEGKVFTIIAQNNAPDHPYISSATLNGQPYDSVTLSHSNLKQGGRLVLTMSDQPVREWGVNDAKPARFSDGSEVLAAPFARPAPRTFRDSLTVQLLCADPLVQRSTQQLANPFQDVDPGERAWIQWRLVGESSWREYRTPLVFKEAAEIEFRSVALRKGSNDLMTSPIQNSRFLKTSELAKLTLGTTYAPQYAAGGDLALLDRLRGPADFRTGFWQGYQGVDLLATLDFGKVRKISRVGIGFLQDQNAWIFYPLQVEFESSTDGVTWQRLGSVAPPDLWSATGVLVHNFELSASGSLRYLRVRGINRGTCPPGHKGAGYPSWIFADEIWVE